MDKEYPKGLLKAQPESDVEDQNERSATDIEDGEESGPDVEEDGVAQRVLTQVGNSQGRENLRIVKVPANREAREWFCVREKILLSSPIVV